MDKIRPAVVISSDSVRGLRVRVVVPITSHAPTKQWLVEIVPDHLNHLKNVGSADVMSIRSIALERFRGTEKIGILAADVMEEVVIAVGSIIELQNS